ncbi:MAG: hypothetical protein SWZ49_01560 [Cyanobacteriota bacterium]|nr:hypothetical protein [Cyanobacteriota bacterium]
MLNNFRKTFVLVAVVATLSTGCKYSKQYQKITETGNQYTTAIDELLDKASELQIDSTSEKLLQNDKSSNVDVDFYNNYKNNDKEILEIISGIREHNNLLREYFYTLKQLAYSETPTEVQQEITGIATNLQTIGSQLQKNPSLPRPIVVGEIGKLVVHSKINRVLKKELQERHPIIIKQLKIQREMLAILGEIMKTRVESIKNSREQRLVINPILEENPIPSNSIAQWMNFRKEILLMDKQVKEIEEASGALNDFQNIYKASVEGKINSQSLNNSLEDIDRFLALLQNNNKSNQDQS